MDALHAAILPVELTNGNDGRGNRWFSSAKRRREIEAIWTCADGHQREPFPDPVTLHVTRILGRGQRLFDPDSLQRGSLKEIIDSLVVLGWLVDDGPKWVREVRTFQDSSRRDIGPAVQIEVFQ